jgi:hypothetical protein
MKSEPRFLQKALLALRFLGPERTRWPFSTLFCGTTGTARNPSRGPPGVAWGRPRPWWPSPGEGASSSPRGSWRQFSWRGGSASPGPRAASRPLNRESPCPPGARAGGGPGSR